MLTRYDLFKSFAENGNVIPVYESFPTDAETPVSAYVKIRGESEYSFLFESVEGNEKIARYSFIGFKPFMIFESKGFDFKIKIFDEKFSFVRDKVKDEKHPLEALNKIMSFFKPAYIDDLPRFSSGAVGYFGYESVSLVEKIPIVENDEIDAPDIFLMFFDSLLVFDNLKRRVFIISNVYKGGASTDLKDEYDKAIERISEIKLFLKKASSEISKVEIDKSLRYNMSQEEFIEKAKLIRGYIVNGDIFQAILSQRFESRINGDPFDIYLKLRVVNPSPYMYFLNIGDLKIIGSSLELLLRVKDGIVETRPVTGTRRRVETADEDEKLEQELLNNDEKEQAKRVMLVDLGRNDLGKISYFGTVKVEQFMVIERYPHDMYIVSSIAGKLRSDVSLIEALYACFPAGAVTGAPKIRAMEIIAEIEPSKRGIYGGAIGYIDFSGNLNLCIATRVIVVKDNMVYFQAGAEITADSIPEREYQKILDKLGAEFRAVGLLSEN